MLKIKNWAICLAMAGLLSMAACTTQAVTILSNLPAVGSGTGTNLGLGVDLADRTKGVGLTMGATSMTFQSMQALISNLTPDSVLSGGIFSSVGGNPGAVLAPFNSVPIPANFAAAEVTLTTAASFTLVANTSYWFVLDGVATSNSLLWQSLAPNVAPTPTGVTFDGYRFSSNGGTTWGNSTTFNGVRISAVPEPASLAMLLGGIGILGWRRRR